MSFSHRWIDLALVLYAPSAFDRATFEPSLELIYNSDKIKHGQHCYDGTLQRWLSDYRDHEYRSCPCQWTHPFAQHALVCAAHLRNGILPCGGGVMDQPALFWDLVQIASAFLRKKEIAEQKASSAKRKKK